MVLEAVLFDKDGTILDFHATWNEAIGHGLRASANDDAALRHAAEALHFDLERNIIAPDSPFVAEPNEVIAALLNPYVDLAVLSTEVLAAANSTISPAAGLPATFDDLIGRGVRLGVVTNDDETIAVEQMAALQWTSRFGAVVGADSGFGAKPDPGMIFGTLERLGVDPANAVMVGDSVHDLLAARAAGVVAVLVTNGAEQPGATIATADLVIEVLTDLVPALEASGRMA